jgi:hypothetical protein
MQQVKAQGRESQLQVHLILCKMEDIRMQQRYNARRDKASTSGVHPITPLLVQVDGQEKTDPAKAANLRNKTESTLACETPARSEATPKARTTLQSALA